MHSVHSRITQLLSDPLYQALPSDEKNFLSEIADEYFLSFQDLKNLIAMGLDFYSWGEGSIGSKWESPPESIKGKNRKQWSIKRITRLWQEMKERAPDYKDENKSKTNPGKSGQVSESEFEILGKDNSTLMGRCPVASEKTRCCNLHTLDAVINCGFDCSYCTIQSFYHGNVVHFQGNLKEKLDNLNLDPKVTYHIGTGQSSDSLMWGNKFGVLGDLFSFAGKNPNVILELKSKSANVSYLMENPPPANVMATWSLNTETIIRKEEWKTASLTDRLKAARMAADSGILVGFHLHPMVRYQGWEKEYGRLFRMLIDNFDPQEVALVSFGTLTYIKPVLRTIRERDRRTKILQMPMEEIGGKYSYPFELKKELFRFGYNSLSSWHRDVFFYLCMEDHDIWKPVFGYEYKDNRTFEETMKRAYIDKINEKNQKSLS